MKKFLTCALLAFALALNAQAKDKDKEKYKDKYKDKESTTVRSSQFPITAARYFFRNSCLGSGPC